MNLIRSAQKYAIYLFFFSLNFQSMDLFNLGIDYLASKISIIILLFISVFNYQSLLLRKHYSRYLTPLLIYFTLLTVISFVNRSYESTDFFDVPFFLNILIFIILINYSRRDPDVLLKAMFCFVLGAFILSLLYSFGINVTYSLDGRVSVLNINANILGLSLCISLFILTSIIFENRLKHGKYRYLLFLLFPFLFILMIKTGSRVAFISLIVGFFVFIYSNNSITKSRKGVLFLVISILSLLIWTFLLKNSVIIERLSSSISEGEMSARNLIWASNFDIIANNFWLGAGKTGYVTETMGYFGGYTDPHLDYWFFLFSFLEL